jgi:D-arabinose 5-phosphate isomerase GutQ
MDNRIEEGMAAVKAVLARQEVVIGVGKLIYIADKIASTLTRTGTRRLPQSRGGGPWQLRNSRGGGRH